MPKFFRSINDPNYLYFHSLQNQNPRQYTNCWNNKGLRVRFEKKFSKLDVKTKSTQFLIFHKSVIKSQSLLCANVFITTQIAMNHPKVRKSTLN